MFVLFLAFSVRFWERPVMNAYTFVPGNWTKAVDKTAVPYPLTQISEFSFPDRPNITTFSGSYNDIELLVTVTSNTTGNATFGNVTFTFELTSEKDSISVAEIDTSDGSHISLSADGQRSIEFCIFPGDGSGQLTSVAFFKQLVDNSSWWVLVFAIGIALGLTWLLKRYVPDIF